MQKSRFAWAVLLLGMVSLLPLSGANTLILGNCMSKKATYLPVSGTDTAGAALFYPASTMRAYQGCKLSELHIAFSNNTSGGSVTLFLSHGPGETPFYTQTVSATKYGWNTLPLTSPYMIDGADLCIGYMARGVKYLNYSPALVSNEEWIWRSKEGWGRYDGKYSASLYATLTGDGLPLNNVRLGAVYVPFYYIKGEKTQMTGVFQNLGAETVSQLTFAYVVDGREMQTETVDGLQVEPRTEGSFLLSEFAFDEEGSADLSLRITAVNGGGDAVDDDNASKPVHALCRSHFVKRNTLLEFFSTERCTACPAAHEAIDRALEGARDVVEMGHHAGFYTDTLTLPESTAYEWFYNPVHVYAPAIMFDRTNWGMSFPDAFSYGVPVMDATAANASTFSALCASVPALVSVEVVPTLSGRHLSLHVEGRQLLPIATPDSLRLHVFLTEDSIYTTRQAGASVGFYHRHAVRKSLTPTWGQPIAVGDGYAADYAFDLPEDWNMERMQAVAFVANCNAADKNDCKVMNAAAVSLGDAMSGIAQPLVAPTDGELPWSIVRVSGSVMEQGRGVETLRRAESGLGGGLYLIRLGQQVIKLLK